MLTSLMGENVDIFADSVLFRLPNTTFQKRVEAVCLQQKLQNDTTGEKSNTRTAHSTVFSDAEKTCVYDKKN
jgi:hypothetical protein